MKMLKNSKISGVKVYAPHNKNALKSILEGRFLKEIRKNTNSVYRLGKF